MKNRYTSAFALIVSSLVACGSDTSGPSKAANPKAYVEYNKDNLQGENLDSLDLTEANIGGGKLNGATLTGANLQRGNADSADFSDAMLAGAYVRGATFVGANFTNAKLTDIDLQDGDFTGAIFDGARIDSSYMRHVTVAYSDLAHSSLDSADLTGADFTGTFLEGTSFAGAVLDSASFAANTGNFDMGSELCHAQSLVAIRVSSDAEAALAQNCPDKLGLAEKSRILFTAIFAQDSGCSQCKAFDGIEGKSLALGFQCNQRTERVHGAREKNSEINRGISTEKAHVGEIRRGSFPS